MSELCAWDLDGTIRPGSLLADAVLHGIDAGIFDPSRFQDPSRPSYAEVDYFVDALTHRSRTDFHEVMDRISDTAREQSYPWAIERMNEQAIDGHAVILSHSPDFMVRAFAKGLGIVKRGRGSHFHTSGLVFSGRALTLNKTAAAQRYIREQKLRRFAFAAGDSMADVPMLKRAEQGAIVNPNDSLAELAEQHDWEIVYADIPAAHSRS